MAQAYKKVQLLFLLATAMAISRESLFHYFNQSVINNVHFLFFSCERLLNFISVIVNDCFCEDFLTEPVCKKDGFATAGYLLLISVCVSSR